MSAQKDEGNVMDFSALQEEAEVLDELYYRYSIESHVLETKLANGMTQCRETRECRLNDLRHRLMPSVQAKIESLRMQIGGGVPFA